MECEVISDLCGDRSIWSFDPPLIPPCWVTGSSRSPEISDEALEQYHTGTSGRGPELEEGTDLPRRMQEWRDFFYIDILKLTCIITSLIELIILTKSTWSSVWSLPLV